MKNIMSNVAILIEHKKLAISNFRHWSDIFTRRGLHSASFYSISVGKGLCYLF